MFLSYKYVKRMNEYAHYIYNQTSYGHFDFVPTLPVGNVPVLDKASQDVTCIR